MRLVNSTLRHRSADWTLRSILSAVLVLACVTVAAADADDVVGAWFVHAPEAPFSYHAFLFHADGTMQQANPDAGTAALSGSDGLGIWVREGDMIRGKFLEIVADRSTLEFESRGEISFEFRLAGDTFRGTANARFFDSEGTLIRGPSPTPLVGKRVRLP